MTQDEAIEALRPTAEARMARISAWNWVGWSRTDRRLAWARERETSERALIRSAQESGMLPAFMVPLLWRLWYSAVWAAIKYWVGVIHDKETN